MFKFNLKNINLPIITIYKNPKDYPNNYVCRLYDIDKPTEQLFICNSLEEARNVIPKNFINFGRHESDATVMVETYL